MAAGAGRVVSCDRRGVLCQGREGLAGHKAALAEETNPDRVQGSADAALAGADVYIGLSAAGAVSVDGIRSMADDADRVRGRWSWPPPMRWLRWSSPIILRPTT
jgi:malate dehydrogenase (oxaloacetate-decarboxylating)